MAVQASSSLSYDGLSDLCGPYDGTDWLGHAFHVVRLGAAGRIPVCICWSSAPGVSSKWLGRGWSIPLVESRIFPIGEKTLELHLPDGYVRYFHLNRDGQFVGGRFWTAERDQDKVRVMADSADGFPKSVFGFFRGRLVRMDCAEGAFEFRHDAQAGDSVVSRGKTVFAIRPKTGDPNEFRIDVGGVRITARKRPAEIPLAPSAEGSAPVTVLDPCLAELAFPDGTKRTFDYGVEYGTARFATEGVTLRWDTTSRFAVACNDCRYEIGKRLNEMSGPKFERIDAEGRRTSFSRDVKAGVTEERFADGRKVVTRRFTSGDNAGRVRTLERSVGGMMEKRIDYIYDANGRVREELVRSDFD